jgi:hypothetical protein
VPTADSLSPPVTELEFDTPKPPSANTWNVLAEDYWDLFTLLR